MCICTCIFFFAVNEKVSIESTYDLLRSALPSAYVPSGPIVFLSQHYVLVRSGATFCYVPPEPIVYPAHDADSLRRNLEGQQKTYIRVHIYIYIYYVYAHVFFIIKYHLVWFRTCHPVCCFVIFN